KTQALLSRRTKLREIDKLNQIFLPRAFFASSAMPRSAPMPSSLLPACEGVPLAPYLGRKFRTKVRGLGHRANLNLALVLVRVRAALDPFERFFHRLHLPQPESGNQLLGLGKRAVDHRFLIPRKPDSLCFRSRMQALR